VTAIGGLGDPSSPFRGRRKAHVVPALVNSVAGWPPTVKDGLPASGADDVRVMLTVSPTLANVGDIPTTVRVVRPPSFP